MSGVQLNVLVALSNAAPLGRLNAWNVSWSLSESVADIVNLSKLSSYTCLLPIGFSTGASPAANTVNLTELLWTADVPSLAVNTTDSCPLKSAGCVNDTNPSLDIATTMFGLSAV